MKENFIITKIDHVIFVGKNDHSGKILTFSNPLKSHELILHLSGKNKVQFNGKTLFCEKNTIRFLPKGENHEYIVEQEEVSECIDVFFNTDTPLSEEAFTLNLKNNPIITNLFKKLFFVWVSKCDGYYFKCISLLYTIFAELQGQNYIPESQYHAIKPAIEYIHKNFLHEKISIPALAEQCGISESYLKRLFIKKFGIPPTKYIIQLKINHAADLLHTRNYTVSQVAELCGYDDPHFFSRQFKAYIGVAPLTFCKKQ